MHVRTTRAVLAAALIAGQTGCLRDDADHCANRGGDTACHELGFGGFCDACAVARNGCVPDRTIVECARPGEETAWDDDDDDGIPLDAGSPPDDPACTPDSEDPACLECLDDQACALGSWCGTDLKCGGCTEHAQCESGACDIEAATCFKPTQVRFVRNTNCTPPGLGTKSAPHCTLATALDGIADKAVIRLVGTGVVYSESIEIVGSGSTLAVIGSNHPIVEPPQFGLGMRSTSVVYVDGVEIRHATQAAVHCTDGGHLWLDDVTLQSSAGAVAAANCEVHVRRSSFVGNDAPVIDLDHSALRLETTFLVGNGTSSDDAVLSARDTQLDIVYATFAGNHAGTQLRCHGDVEGSVRNSVVLGDARGSISCPTLAYAHAVLDTAVGGEGLILLEQYDRAWFVDLEQGNARLRDAAGSPFAAVARWSLGDPRTDIDGRARGGPGVPDYAGADVP